ncbi:MAG: AAA family ATPase, partial [Bacteroidota bacterium]
MYIKEVKLHNFRIYKGEQSVLFNTTEGKNIYIISGNNGFGKTTFLISLVWCLYGKTMKDVDGIYRRQILDAGGYNKFLGTCLNRKAKAEGDPHFSVSITFGDISIPTVLCKEVKITRTFQDETEKESLAILIDDLENELTNEVGPEIFIQDFILPKEIAKFFFFDAEKIVSLAELKSLEEKRRLSRAYAEVLGIKKYEDLRDNMENLRIRFRKEVASKEDREKLEQLDAEVQSLTKKIELDEEEVNQLLDDKVLKKNRSDALQEKLIREGNSMSLAKLKELKKEKEELNEKLEQLKSRFQSFLDLAPFAIASKTVNEIEKQVKLEAQSQDGFSKKELDTRTKRLLSEIKGDSLSEFDPESLKKLKGLI